MCMHPMRKANREIKDREEIKAIIEKCRVCRLAMVEDGRPYIVPMNFGYEMQGAALVLYFHCAAEGRKIDILQQNPAVCFELDCSHRLVEADTACGYSFDYESVIGNGRVEFLSGDRDKRRGLRKLMERTTGLDGVHWPDDSFDDKIVEQVTVIKVVSTEFTGKRLKH